MAALPLLLTGLEAAAETPQPGVLPVRVASRVDPAATQAQPGRPNGTLPGALGIDPTQRRGLTTRADRIFGAEVSADELREIDRQLLEDTRLITDPGERALSLIRIAASKDLGEQYEQAENALKLAGPAAAEVQNITNRDRLLVGVASGWLDLARDEALTSITQPSSTLLEEPEQSGGLEKRFEQLRKASNWYAEAAGVARQIIKPSYRSETLYEVVRNAADAAKDLFGRTPSSDPLNEFLNANREVLAPIGRQQFSTALEIAQTIERTAWRDRSLVEVASAAGYASQFDLALQAARAIPFPETRAEALISVAESQSRRRQGDGSTQTYHEAARTIARVPIADLRATLTSVLVDSLISSGRFEDARASVVLYPDEPRKVEALGAVARAQGSRGLGDEARRWIQAEVSPQYHSFLYRHVNDGLLQTLEKFRTDSSVLMPSDTRGSGAATDELSNP